jgi:hypothetical protein
MHPGLSAVAKPDAFKATGSGGFEVPALEPD